MLSAIKNILKRIFPVVFYRKVSVWYIRVKSSTIDRIIFPEYIRKEEDFLLYKNVSPLSVYHLSLEGIKDLQVKTIMKYWDTWKQEEYILHEQSYTQIEPQFGWGITSGKLHYYSLGISRAFHQAKPQAAYKRKPATLKLPDAISLRDTGEENYFHFYNDVLCKLFLLQEYKIDVLSLPVIVSSKLWNKSFFQFYLKHSVFLQSIKWVVQDEQLIGCDKIWFCKPLTHRKPYLDKVIDLLPASLMQDHGKGPVKVFLIRSKSRLRFLGNQEELATYLSAKGFMTVDADQLTLEEQIRLFSNCEYLIGIHGAGMMNMIYRRGKPMRILELFPPAKEGYLPFHYIMLAKQYGFDYEAVMGTENLNAYSGAFSVSTSQLTPYV